MTECPSILRCDGPATTLIFDCRDEDAVLAYAGSLLPETEDLKMLCDAGARGRHESQPDVPAGRSILPQSGWGHMGTPAVSLTRDGLLLPARLLLRCADAIAGSARFVFEDDELGVSVALRWNLTGSGVVTADTRITNRSTAPVGVAVLASVALPLPRWASQVERFTGRWAGEMHSATTPLRYGAVGSAAFGGRAGFEGSQWICFDTETTSETAGGSIAAHLGWSGDAWHQVDCNADGEATLLMGARLDPGEIVVQSGESWAAPQAMFALGQHGRSATRHAFHAHFAESLPPLSNTPRKVHLNSWEALGFNLDLAKLTRLADDAAALGVERFVLDDGWFAGRRNDRSALGDWTPDPGLFPEGLSALIDHVAARGMDFGLWVEPEMVSPDSQLSRQHPDWCLHVAAAPRPTQRNQLVLDLSRPEVIEYIFAALDALLRDNAIDYLKWDHNRDLFPRAGRGHAQTAALYALLDQIRAAHPRVEIETCASGGGRVDLAILERCTRFWASDNNDAIERLRINRGWFEFLPLKATGNHVGPSPNPVTGRRLAMDFRAKVALFGHMGVEADPLAMSEDERLCLAGHIAIYKEWREVLHGGRLWTIGCADPGVSGWFCFDGRKGIALAAQTGFAKTFNVPPVRLPGLEPDASYRIKLPEPWPAKAARYLAHAQGWKDGLQLSGQALAERGLALPLTHPETAWLITVERVS